MAVSVADLAVHLRISADPAAALPAAHQTVLTEMLAAATARIEEIAPAAPDALKDRAVIQLCGYLNEAPAAPAGAGYAAALRNSGALHVLANHVTRRAVTIGAD